jgi:two-component system sensor histidine kinase BaeS
VVTNLLSNAIQYGGSPGKICVTVRVEEKWAALVISDSGPGIAAGDLPHVFERFYRGDKSRARSHGNYGLGLAICKTIVDAHKGSIEVASAQGSGATFTVKLLVFEPVAPPAG